MTRLFIPDSRIGSRLEPLVGFEPTDSALTINRLGEALSLLSSPDLKLLLRVIEEWPRMSSALKLAAVAIVEASKTQEG